MFFRSSNSDASVKEPSRTLNLFLKPPSAGLTTKCIQVSEDLPTISLWNKHVIPALTSRNAVPSGLVLKCCGRTLEISERPLRDFGVANCSTIEVTGRLPSQPFSRLHQLVEHLLEALAPSGAPGAPLPTQPAADDASQVQREPLLHSIDKELAAIKKAPAAGAELAEGGGGDGEGSEGGGGEGGGDRGNGGEGSEGSVGHRCPIGGSGSIGRSVDGHGLGSDRSRSDRYAGYGGGMGGTCGCAACCQRPNSTLWLCGALLHSNDAAVVGCAFRVVQLLLRARVDCAPPLVYFNDSSGALTLADDEAQHGWLYRVVAEALTPEGVAIASLLSLKQPYDAKTHPLLWQHPTKKQTLLEFAARANLNAQQSAPFHSPALLRSLLPALNLSRLAGGGALSAVSMVGYKALNAMANNVRPELLSLLLQTGIISVQHALMLLESVLQKKGKVHAIDRVVCQMLAYIGAPAGEAGNVLRVAAAYSSAAVLRMLLSWMTLWSASSSATPDLQLLGVALAEACARDNEEVTKLLLESWSGKCTALQAQPLLRAFASRGDAATVGRLLSQGKGAMVQASRRRPVVPPHRMPPAARRSLNAGRAPDLSSRAAAQMDTPQRIKLASCGLADAAGDAAQRALVLKTLLGAGGDPVSE
jgi:hypothetical protein